MTCELRIRGEYWITDCGLVLFADGDSGDYNHVAYALQYAIDLLYASAEADPVASALLCAVGQDASSWDSDVTALREALLNASDMLAAQYPELVEGYQACFVRAGVPQSALKAMWCVDTDPRQWAMTDCGWMIVKSDRVVLHGLSDARVKVLRDGLWDILMQEGLEDLSNYECEVVDAKTDTLYVANLMTLEGGLLSDLYPVSRSVANLLNRR